MYPALVQRFSIHDRDSKFSASFDEYFRPADGGVVLTPYQAPIANCFIESWIGSLKRGCLNQLSVPKTPSVHKKVALIIQQILKLPSLFSFGKANN